MVKKYKVARVLLMIIAAFIGINIITYSVRCKAIKEDYQVSIDATTKLEEEYLNTYLTSAGKDYYHTNKLYTQNLRIELIEELGKDKLQEEFTSKEYSSEFYDICADVLYNNNKMLNESNPKGFVYLANREGIMACFSNTPGATEQNYDNQVIPWEDFYNNYNNPEYRKQLNEQLLTGKKQYMIMTMDPNTKEYKEITMEDVAKAYMKDGMEGIKDYRLITCGRITDTGDILGNSDTQFMQSTTNYKLYVITIISIPDIIEEKSEVIEKNSINLQKALDAEERLQVEFYRMTLNVLVGLILFALTAVLYSEKFEK